MLVYQRVYNISLSWIINWNTGSLQIYQALCCNLSRFSEDRSMTPSTRAPDSPAAISRAQGGIDALPGHSAIASFSMEGARAHGTKRNKGQKSKTLPGLDNGPWSLVESWKYGHVWPALPCFKKPKLNSAKKSADGRENRLADLETISCP